MGVETCHRYSFILSRSSFLQSLFTEEKEKVVEIGISLTRINVSPDMFFLLE